MGISINSAAEAAGTYQNVTASSQDQQKTKQVIKETLPENPENAVSKDGDTLTISDAGKSASMDMGNQDESENATDDLSGYTEAELKQMYLDGTITKSEYDEELESRQN